MFGISMIERRVYALRKFLKWCHRTILKRSRWCTLPCRCVAVVYVLLLAFSEEMKGGGGGGWRDDLGEGEGGGG